MTLRDISSGPDWLGWGVSALFLIVAIVLLSGRGSWMLAGYNTAPKEKKEQYDEKKLCRITGAGMLVIGLAALLMFVFQDSLPAYVANIFGGLVFVIVIVILILDNTVAKKK